MDIKALFNEAAAASKNLSSKPDNDSLLQLYSLYKQSTEGDNNAEPSSNMFDFVAKAKYDAWASIKGKSRETAMEAYVTLVNRLRGV